MQIRQCIEKLSKMTKEEVQFQYGYPDPRMADAVRNRSVASADHAGAGGTVGTVDAGGTVGPGAGGTGGAGSRLSACSIERQML